jgi:hypothetical protein
MEYELLDRYEHHILSCDERAFHSPFEDDELIIDNAEASGRALRLVYAPFEHVNVRARIAIVGLTPGARQASDALLALRAALLAGAGRERALAMAKSHASFSGPMRSNLVRMLDAVGVAAWLGVGSTAELWGDSNHLVQFTSTIPYPLAIDGANWSGQPDVLGNGAIRGWFKRYGTTQFAQLRDAIIVPLGPAVTRAMLHLASAGVVDPARVLVGLPHPSGANAERIACFLGTKPAELASARTDAAALLRARESLARQVASIAQPAS